MHSRKPAKLSTKRAELAANAILAGPRRERAQAAARHMRLHVWLYPELKRFPPLLRRRVLECARSSARTSHWPFRVVIALIGITAVLLFWPHSSGQLHAGAWLCVAFAIAAQIAQQQVALRRYIRRADPESVKVDTGDR